jgi:hypothetical protein
MKYTPSGSGVVAGNVLNPKVIELYTLKVSTLNGIETGVLKPGTVICMVGATTTGGSVSYCDVSAIPNVLVSYVLITKKSSTMIYYNKNARGFEISSHPLA